MGSCVCAYATSHILFSPNGVEDQARRIVAGMSELGRRAAAAKPDLMLMIASDHLINFNLALQPPFLVGVADEYTCLGDMDIPVRPFPGHRSFAEGLVRYAADRGFDLAKAEELTPDHAVTLPLLFVKPWGSVPVVPLIVNINMEPVPATGRCYALGQAIRDYIRERRPAGERIAVVGSGGLSHWLRIPNEGHVAVEHDTQIMDLFVAGKVQTVARMTTQEIAERHGNGGLEILNWVTAAAAAGEPPGERIYYEPVSMWQTGMGGVSLNVQKGHGTI